MLVFYEHKIWTVGTHSCPEHGRAEENLSNLGGNHIEGLMFEVECLMMRVMMRILLLRRDVLIIFIPELWLALTMTSEAFQEILGNLSNIQEYQSSFSCC